MCRFCHLHLHSYYSFLDAAASPEEIVAYAKELGQCAVAVTDHGNLFSWPELADAADKYGVKAIYGCELYFVPDDIKSKQDYHLLVIAKNQEGLKNLMKLSSLAYIEGFYKHPRINRKMLEEHKDGLIVTSGCVSSYINNLLLEGKINEAKKEIEWYLSVFKEDFYIELQYHGLKSEKTVNKYLLELAKYYNIKLIGTNDAHYKKVEDAVYHDGMLAVQTGKNINDKNRLRFTDDTGEKILSEFYIKSYEEMLDNDLFKEYPEALYNTIEIVEKCEASFIVDSNVMNFPLPRGIEEDKVDEYFENLVCKSAKEKLGTKYENDLYAKRLEYEIDVIKRMGFSKYFLFVRDVIEIAREKDILVGPGRGSAAGSLVAYVLGITSLDPVKYNLLFERFLNPERVSPPDIDIDFEDRRRHEIIEEIKKRYGEDRVAKIITFSYLGAKMAIRDAFRAYGISVKETNDFMDFVDPILGQNDNVEVLLNNKVVIDYIREKPNSEDFINALNLAKFLEGRPRQPSIHAAGIIVSPSSLLGNVPLAVLKQEDNSNEKEIVTQFDMKILERMGYLKIDILGLAYLSAIHECLKMIKKNKKLEIDIFDIDVNDKEVFELFQRGETTGIFQFESEGMKTYLRKLKPDNIYDLIAMNALYRPGPLEYIDVYINRKHGLEKVEYPHEKLERVLKETYGVMVYQEQIMETVKVIAGYSLAKADLIRRAIGKKIKEIIDDNRKDFITRAVENAIDEESARKIFDMIERFADYGFNKSHAAAYSYLAYVTAYLKAKYKEYYYAALMNINIGDYEKISFLIKEALQENVKIEGPDINISNKEFQVIEGPDNSRKIVYGLLALKGIKEKAVNKILDERTKRGLFINLEDFLNKISSNVVDKKTLETLIQAGALDKIAGKSGYKRENLLHPHNFEIIINIKQNKVKESKEPIKTVSLFDIQDEGEIIKLNLDTKLKISQVECAVLEKSVVGIVFSNYLDMLEMAKKISGFINIEVHTNIKDCNENENLALFFIEEIKEKMSKKNTTYYEAAIIAQDGEYELFINEANYKNFIKPVFKGKGIYLAIVQGPSENFTRFTIKKIYATEELINQQKINKQLKNDIENIIKIKTEKEQHKEYKEKKENKDYIKKLINKFSGVLLENKLEMKKLDYSILQNESIINKYKNYESVLAMFHITFVGGIRNIYMLFNDDQEKYYAFMKFCLDLAEHYKNDPLVLNKVYNVSLENLAAYLFVFKNRVDPHILHNMQIIVSKIADLRDIATWSVL